MMTHAITERQTLTVEEAAVLLGIGRISAYQAVARGELPALRVGRRLIPRAALDRLLADMPAWATTTTAERRA
jgi:excisionase family DNA binding protein